MAKCKWCGGEKQCETRADCPWYQDGPNMLQSMMAETAKEIEERRKVTHKAYPCHGRPQVVMVIQAGS